MLFYHELFIHASIFTIEKKDRLQQATCECRSLYPALNIVRVLSIHVFYICIYYISQVKTRSIHSQKESGKCRTFYSMHIRKRPCYQTKVNIETRGFRTRVCRLKSNWIRDTDGDTPIRRGMWTRDSSQRNERGPQHLRA